MTARMLKIATFAAFVLLVAPAQAQMNRTTAIGDEVAAVIAALAERAPFNTWDDLRIAAPRNVHWHLSPPDEADAARFRRSGWLEADGVQAGIAACGVRGAPVQVTLRVSGATWRATEQDPVIVALGRLLAVNLEHHEPTMVGEVERFGLTAEDGRQTSILRVENCSREGGAARRRCDTTYEIDVRPEEGRTPLREPCDAP